MFKCDLCPQSFLSARGISNHTKNHNGERVYYQCTLCNKQLQSSAGFRYHMAVKHSTEESPNYSCGKCSYKTRYKHCLTNHVKRVHDGVKRNVCYFCGMKFFAFADLVRHCGKMHTLEK